MVPWGRNAQSGAIEMVDETSRGARYLVFEKVVASQVRRGARSCSKKSQRIVDAMRATDPTSNLARMAMPGVTDVERGIVGFMKARCGLCPFKCEAPVR